MGAKSGSKAARHAKQNGGKGGKPSDVKEPQNVSPDLSVLRKPVEISVPGLSQVVKVLQTGTKEVQHILSCECDIIYECKVCRNLFRSLANLISHKRVYCTQLYSNLHHSTYRKDKGVNDNTVFVQPEEVGDNRSETWVTNDGAGEKKGRKEKGKPGPFRITIKKDLTSIVEKLMEKNASQSLADMVSTSSTPTEYYENIEKELKSKSKHAKEHTIHLETIENSSSGIFQTVLTNPAAPKQLMKSQVADLEKLLSETEAVLGPDGKVVENGVGTSHLKPPEGGKKKDSAGSNRKKDLGVVTAPESAVELYCNLCKIHFSTYKTLNHHMKSFHMTFRRYYPCPCCKISLSNSWSVFRHLLKVHRKTNDQVRRLRDQVMKKAYVTQVLQSGAQKLINPSSKPVEEAPSPDPEQASKLQNQENKAWMDQFEDEYDLQRCGGCGRRFERRAALAAHSQICHRRSEIPSQSHQQAPLPSQGSKQTPAAAEVKVSVKKEMPTPMPPLLPIIHANLNALKENQRSPNLPLFHPAHLLEQNQMPSKKIEIQVRRDYGKSNNMTPEYRARTPSICRSDEGGTSSASLGKSEDASVNSDNNGESSDTSATHKNERVDLVVKSGVEAKARYPARKSSSSAGSVLGTPTVNGVKRKPSTSVPALEKMDDLKRNKLSRYTGESDVEEDSELKRIRDENEAKMAAMTNVRKLLCLTCKKKYKTLGNLRRHVATHIGWFRFRCMVCDFKCFAKYDCVNHALNTHLEAWEKHKALAMVVDLQLESGGSHDPLSSESVADSADSEATCSDITASSSPDKESCHAASSDESVESNTPPIITAIEAAN